MARGRKAKLFDEIAAPAAKRDRVSSDLARATGVTVREPASDQERTAREAAGKTQGKKGCRLIRISLALPTSENEYVRLMSRATGVTMSEFITECVRLHRDQNQAAETKAREFLAALKPDSANFPEKNFPKLNSGKFE